MSRKLTFIFSHKYKRHFSLWFNVMKFKSHFSLYNKIRAFSTLKIKVIYAVLQKVVVCICQCCQLLSSFWGCHFRKMHVKSKNNFWCHSQSLTDFTAKIPWNRLFQYFEGYLFFFYKSAQVGNTGTYYHFDFPIFVQVHRSSP